ncbi:hypothetical protein OH77DRAFT_1230997 [Trametes cingulata]|nr:hypothetical protein OH77DRAFT_1230997 [Trametes cingulata]
MCRSRFARLHIMHLNPTHISRPVSSSSAALPMSSNSPTKYNGLWIVQLGGDPAWRGIHVRWRPAQTALGQYKPLLPVIVTCAYEQDAKAINQLNNTIFNVVSTEDNHSLAHKCENPPVTEIRIHGSLLYAFRVAMETGVWIGFEWSHISHIINTFKPKNSATWCKPTTISQALVFMLSKPGYNLPLLPAEIVTRPWMPTSDLRTPSNPELLSRLRSS